MGRRDHYKSGICGKTDRDAQKIILPSNAPVLAPDAYGAEFCLEGSDCGMLREAVELESAYDWDIMLRGFLGSQHSAKNTCTSSSACATHNSVCSRCPRKRKLRVNLLNVDSTNRSVHPAALSLGR